MAETSSQIEKINQQMRDAGCNATFYFEKMVGLDPKLRELHAEQESVEEQRLRRHAPTRGSVRNGRSVFQPADPVTG